MVPRNLVKYSQNLASYHCIHLHIQCKRCNCSNVRQWGNSSTWLHSWLWFTVLWHQENVIIEKSINEQWLEKLLVFQKPDQPNFSYLNPKNLWDLVLKMFQSRQLIWLVGLIFRQTVSISTRQQLVVFSQHVQHIKAKYLSSKDSDWLQNLKKTFSRPTDPTIFFLFPETWTNFCNLTALEKERDSHTTLWYPLYMYDCSTALSTPIYRVGQIKQGHSFQ